MDVGKDSIDLGLYIQDVAGCRRFYGESLGLPYEGEMVVGGGIRMYRYLIGTTVLKLLVADAGTPKGPSERGAQLGLRYFTITVPNLEAAIAQLHAGGVEPLGPMVSPRPSIRVAFFADPDGNTVELLENVG